MKYKAYCDKKANASKLREEEHVYVLPLNADYQLKTTTYHPWVDPYIVGKAVSKNYLVNKVGTDETQIFHRMKMQPFMLRERTHTNVHIMSPDWKRDPELVIKHDGLHARA